MKKINPFGFLRRKQFRYGSYTTVVTLIVLAVVIAVNMALGAIERNWALTFDMSGTGAYSISDEAKEFVKSIDQEVHIYTLFPDSAAGELRTRIDEMLNRYRALNNLITYENVDPTKNPTFANKFKGEASTVGAGSVIVADANETRFRTMSSNDFLLTSQDPQTGQSYYSGFGGEEKVVSALMYVVAKNTPVVYFLQGHKELAYSSTYALRVKMADQNFDPKELMLSQDTVFNPGDVVVILSPQNDLLDEQRDILKNFLANGGRMLYTADVDAPELPNFDSLLQLYGMGMGDGLVIESANEARRWIQVPYLLLPILGDHDITNTLRTNNGMVIVPQPCPVKMPEMPISSITTTALLTTSDNAYAKVNPTAQSDFSQQPDDPKGPFVLAAAVEKKNYDDEKLSMRMVVMGSTACITSGQMLESFDNESFFMDTMGWLVNQKIGTTIRAKALDNSYLRIPDAATAWTLAAIVVIVIPVGVLAAGIVVWLRRRHK